MKTTEILYGKKNENRLKELGPDLAGTYRVAFAGEPWYEKSRCDNDICRVGFSSLNVGEECDNCRGTLAVAYPKEELTSKWMEMLKREDALFEISSEDGYPIRASIARPTSKDELYERKYSEIPPMQDWIAENLPEEFVWIEDTFADRNKQPRGNLSDRGKTLGRIAAVYSGLSIATRTLAVPVVSATLRDVGANTNVYVGTGGVGVPVNRRARSVGSVPDRRTLMKIDGACTNE